METMRELPVPGEEVPSHRRGRMLLQGVEDVGLERPHEGRGMGFSFLCQKACSPRMLLKKQTPGSWI